jgi:hypothetical protein
MQLLWRGTLKTRRELNPMRSPPAQSTLVRYTEVKAAARATYEGRVIERMWDYLTAGGPE